MPLYNTIVKHYKDNYLPLIAVGLCFIHRVWLVFIAANARKQ